MFFSRQSFSLFKMAFERIADDESAADGVLWLFRSLLAHAQRLDSSLGTHISNARQLGLSHARIRAERICYFESLVDVSRLELPPGQARIELGHLMLSAFSVLQDKLQFDNYASLLATRETVRRACIELTAFDREEECRETVDARFVVIASSLGKIDDRNDYSSLTDAIRAMKIIERRAGLRGESSSSETEYRSYVLVLVPDQVQRVFKVAIHIAESNTLAN